MSVLHIKQVGATTQRHLLGKQPLISGVFPIRTLPLFEQTYVVLTDVHSSHLCTVSLLMKQINTVQDLPSLKHVAKFSFQTWHPFIIIQNAKERWTESYLLFPCHCADVLVHHSFHYKVFKVLFCTLWSWALQAVFSAFIICFKCFKF